MRPSRAAQIVLCIIIFAWMAKIVLFPIWVGVFYNKMEIPGESGWYHGGGFAIGKTDYGQNAPIWLPPVHHNPEGMQVSVRWPWQEAIAHEQLEIVESSIFIQWSFALILWGIGSLAINYFARTQAHGLFNSLLTSVAEFQVIALIALVILSVSTRGYGTNASILRIVFLGALATGIAYGLWAYGRGIGRQEFSATNPQNVVQQSPGRVPSNSAIRSLLQFLLGLIASVIVATAIIATVNVLLAIVRPELSMPHYDLRVQLGEAALIVAVGILLRYGLIRCLRARTAGQGFLLGATGMAVLCALWH